MQVISLESSAPALALSTDSRTSSADQTLRQRPFLLLQPLPPLLQPRRQYSSASDIISLIAHLNSQRRERPLNYHNARAVTKPKTSTPKTGSSSGGSSFSGLLGDVGNGAAALDSGIGIINGVKSFFDPPAPATVTAPAASAATSSATTA